MMTALTIVLLLISAVVYMLPTIIAACRDHPQTFPIFLFNLFLGWTFLGWVVALVWSFWRT